MQKPERKEFSSFQFMSWTLKSPAIITLFLSRLFSSFDSDVSNSSRLSG